MKMQFGKFEVTTETANEYEIVKVHCAGRLMRIEDELAKELVYSMLEYCVSMRTKFDAILEASKASLRTHMELAKGALEAKTQAPSAPKPSKRKRARS